MADPIIAAIDGSDTAKKAAVLAARRAEKAGAKLILAYVVEWSPYSVMTPQDLEVQHTVREKQISEAREKLLQPLKDELSKPGLEIELVVRHGHAAQVIIELIKSVKAQEIVIGRTGHSKWSAAIFGSTANALAQSSPVPVTIVPDS